MLWDAPDEPETAAAVSALRTIRAYLFKTGERQAHLNLKGYPEFDTKNRPEGWNVWLTLSIPLGSAKK